MPRRVVDLFACRKGWRWSSMCSYVGVPAFCGVFGGKKIIDVLKIARRQW
jgi:hypothetical protein